MATSDSIECQWVGSIASAYLSVEQWLAVLDHIIKSKELLQSNVAVELDQLLNTIEPIQSNVILSIGELI